MSNYELHEFDPVKVITKEIDTTKVESIKYVPYTKNSKGTTVIDKNSEIDYSRTLISLQTSKSSQAKFNQVVNIDFEEFTNTVNNATSYLTSKVQALEATKSKLLASNTNKDQQIKELEDEINGLKEYILEGSFTPATEPNNVPDTLFANKALWADRTGEPGAPGYPDIADKLLSKGRKAIAKIQQDGNFVVLTGEFDANGVATGQTEVKTAFGWNTKNNSVSGVHLYAPANSNQGQLEIVRISPWEVAWGSGRQKLSNAARLVLDDNGILTLYDGEIPKWSSFGM